MSKYSIQETSLQFALLVIDAYKYLVSSQKEFILSKQFLRSWTSIWANIQEANQWSSKKDFLYKMNIQNAYIFERSSWNRISNKSRAKAITLIDMDKKINLLHNQKKCQKS